MIDHLCGARGLRLEREECRSRLGEADGVLYCQPQTFMNRSGSSLRCLAERYGLEPGSILVLYDEVALPLGRLRARGRGGPAGHRGMESVIESLRTDEVPRIRMGIGPPPSDWAGELSEYVLSPFAPAEQEWVEVLIERAATAVAVWIQEGIAAVMNRFNAEPLRPDEVPG